MTQVQASNFDFSVDTPSTSTNYPDYYCDVFINHRGTDVKNTFASHLYHRLHAHGLLPFLDREELRAGELLSPQIEDAIRTASVHIVILSPRYAESRWCLDELVLILKSRATVIPVFYNVKPSEVRYPGNDGQYSRALDILEEKRRYGPGRLENWRKALSEVSSFCGFELEAYNGDEGKLLDNIIQCVLKKGRSIGLNVARYPTGLEEKVEDFEKIMSLQQRQSGKVKVLGIVGLGGLGKTTLAKEIFNKKSSNFGKSSFLFDVRENAGRRSLKSLQTKLIKDLVHRDVQIDHVDQGIEMLKTYLSTCQNALVILDDVDHADQLHAFFPIKEVLPSDSLILVTSRYKDALTSSGISDSSIYKLTGLNEQHSQQLFCLHAFCQPHPPPGFQDLVYEFCRACGGLPLSLKVFGGLLCEKNDKSYWEGLLERLRQLKLPNEIQQSLKLSYDALDEDEKKIFLDIACSFIGEDRDMAIRIWDGSGWNGLLGFSNLENRCLVEVDRGKNTIKMHDHLRDLGRELVDQEKSSHRFWRLIGNIDDLLNQSTLITEVRGIRTVPGRISFYDIPESKPGEELSRFKSWCDEVFRKRVKKLFNSPPYCFRKLQLLATEDGHLESILERVESPNLIWLRWNNCPFSCLPSWIPMKNIRVLEVVGNKLKVLWREESQAPLELRELIIHCPLSNFPKSIGQLKHIEKIVVDYKSHLIHLKTLPEEFCYLRSLKYLRLCSCPDMELLPDSFGYLTNLQHLDLSFCRSLQGLPNSFRNLIRLKYLDLGGCRNLIMTEETFANSSSLEYLNLSGCQIVEVLPPQVAHQPSLQALNLVDTRLRELPGDIGNLWGLEILELGSPLLEMLPRSLGHLSCLKELWLYNCSELKTLPGSLGLLTQLSTLWIYACGIQSLPPEVVKMNNLVKLTVIDCPLRALPLKKQVEGESETLTELNKLDTSIDNFPQQYMSRLKYLLLRSTEISEISFIGGVCPGLQHLIITYNNDLVEIGALPPTLIELELIGCRQLRKLEGLCNLKNLQALDISECIEIEELPGLERMISLNIFKTDGCPKLKEDYRARAADKGMEQSQSLKQLR